MERFAETARIICAGDALAHVAQDIELRFFIKLMQLLYCAVVVDTCHIVQKLIFSRKIETELAFDFILRPSAAIIR